MHRKDHNFFHYASLILFLSAGFILIYLAADNPLKQVYITSAVACLYVTWGIIHHYLKGDLHARIVLEYSLIAALAVILVRGALLR